MVLVINSEGGKIMQLDFFPLRIKTEQTIFSPHIQSILGIAAAVLCGEHLIECSICSHTFQAEWSRQIPKLTKDGRCDEAGPAPEGS